MPRYARVMSQEASPDIQDPPVDTVLQRELVRGDAALAGVVPVLTHFLATPGEPLVTDDVIARMRGMVADLARQLLAFETDLQNRDTAEGVLGRMLSAQSAVISHCYAVVVEGQLTLTLEEDFAHDPVLSPLIQELIASENSETGEVAMAVMAAQARFMQNWRRMALPLEELPGDLFHEVIATWHEFNKRRGTAGPDDTIGAQLRQRHDESASRRWLLGRLVSSMGNAGSVGLSLDHAGLAMFATALSSLTDQARELAVLSCQDRQGARLALLLVAAGAKQADVQRALATLHPNVEFPGDLPDLSRERARELIASQPASNRG